jgi:hypothetical protein
MSNISDIITAGKTIKKWIEKFRNKELNFLEDSKILDNTKKLKKNEEYQYFQNYVTDEKTRILFQMGLTLRDLENDKPTWEGLRNKIYKTHNTRGLHIAQFVQNRLFLKYLDVVTEKGLTHEQCSAEIQKFFDNIEITNSFVQINDNIEAVAATIIARLRVNSPHVYVISGSYESAIKKCKQIKGKVMKEIKDYTVTHFDTGITEVYFLKKSYR